MRIRNALVLIVLTLSIGCQDKKAFVLPKTDTDNGGLFLPDGFGALVVADSVGPSRHLAIRDNGDIYVKLSISTGELGNIALQDTNADGRADIFQRFGDYPNDGSFATEMRIHNGYLYYSSERMVYRQKLVPNQLIPEGKPEVLFIDHYPIKWHNAKSLAFDNKGGMYITLSAPTNNCEDWNTVVSPAVANVKGQYPCRQLIDMGGIWKFDEDKLEQDQASGQRFATGLRSVVAISWNEEDNSLYAVQHGRDYLHGHAPQYFSAWQNAVLPAEEFMKIQEGENYGWPYSYYDHFKHKRMKAPEYGGDGVREATGYADPIMGLPAHFAPNDLLFYKGDQFPARYKKGAFIAFHGSINRAPYPQAGYVVGFVPFENGNPTDKWEVFADGFAGVDTVKNMIDARYRPVGLAEGPDGSLYVSDSKKGKIWRIVFAGDPTKFGDDQLAGMEKRKSRTYLKIPEAADTLTVK
ncbi:MAG TPA: PQQ-dependent sugar dehydrogenase [Chryseolinea sp.]